jgi:predicted O-methyltransferase YrrM
MSSVIEPGAPLQWTAPDVVAFDGITYRTFGDPDGLLDAATLLRLSTLRSTPEEMVLAKTRSNIERCLEAYRDLRPVNAIELGIYEGGSVALLATLCRPGRLVALDLDPEPRLALEEVLRRQGLEGSVALHYGVDQADRARLTEIVEQEFEGPLDLVIDDASHLVAQTRASFNLLFPRLRPGGLYAIEDWAWAHTSAPGLLPDQPPLSQLVFELVVASATASEAITSVEVNRELTLVRRGPQPLDPEHFDLRDLVDDRARGLLREFP